MLLLYTKLYYTLFSQRQMLAELEPFNAGACMYSRYAILLIQSAGTFQHTLEFLLSKYNAFDSYHITLTHIKTLSFDI